MRKKVSFVYSGGAYKAGENGFGRIKASPVLIAAAGGGYRLACICGGEAVLFEVSDMADTEISEEDAEEIPEGFDAGKFISDKIYGVRDSGAAVLRCKRPVFRELVREFGDRVHILIENEGEVSAAAEVPCERLLPWLLCRIDSCEAISPIRLREEIEKRIKNSPYLK